MKVRRVKRIGDNALWVSSGRPAADELISRSIQNHVWRVTDSLLWQQVAMEISHNLFPEEFVR